MKDGGPAFPSVNDVRVGDFGTTGHPGASLRDWFAGKALAAALAHERTKPIEEHIEDDTARLLADQCYLIADAMIAARKPTNA